MLSIDEQLIVFVFLFPRTSFTRNDSASVHMYAEISSGYENAVYIVITVTTIAA